MFSQAKLQTAHIKLTFNNNVNIHHVDGFHHGRHFGSSNSDAFKLRTEKKRKRHWHFEKSSEVTPTEIIQEQKSPPFLELPHFYVTGDLDSSLTVEKAIRNTAFVPCVK